jgi:glutamyl-tRNA synthetase
VEHFDWQRVNTVGPVFDVDKLDWLNGHYLRALAEDDLAGRLLARLQTDGLVDAEPTDRQREVVRAVTPLVQTRMVRLSEAAGMVGFLLVTDEALVVEEDAAASLPANAPAVLDAAVAALEPLAQWRDEEIEAALRVALIDGLGIKPKVAFGPLRVAVTGRRVSPPLFESLQILGKPSSLTRLRALRGRLG